MLYINPHTSFYFRPEVHMVSEEGLNAYGAVTWGQFFIYQGFNEYCGWMHTSSNADVSDVYKETIQQVNGKYVYRYDGKDLPVQTKQESITYVKDGQYAQQSFTVYSTGHGPVMGKQGQQWLSVKSFNRSIDGLMQSWLRTKAKGLADMRKVMEYRANTSNNTVYADAQGNIGYWHGNFMPIRDTAYDWGKAVDGTTSKTEWKGLHPATATIQVINPNNGWLQNCNSTPFTVAGSNSPKRNAYPPYMAPDGENFRGLNAVRVLSKQDKFHLEEMIAAGYDTYLTAFEILVPALAKAYDDADEATKQALAEPMKVMRTWDYRSNENSVATTLAVEWAQFQLSRAIQQVYIEQGDDDQVARTRKFAATVAPQELLKTFQNTINQLVKQHGTWNMPWGELNRFQRLNGAIDLQYDDNAASLPVGFVSSTWGSLPSFNSRYANNTKKRYGFNGNSFIAAVEFGKKVRAKSVLAGGNSSDPASPYFTNQAAMYTKGQFKDVLFYKADVLKNAVKTYHP
jgi:acyl-homoserine lactone acylase PvdQ